MSNAQPADTPDRFPRPPRTNPLTEARRRRGAIPELDQLAGEYWAKAEPLRDALNKMLFCVEQCSAQWFPYFKKVGDALEQAGMKDWPADQLSHTDREISGVWQMARYEVCDLLNEAIRGEYWTTEWATERLTSTPELHKEFRNAARSLALPLHREHLSKMSSDYAIRARQILSKFDMELTDRTRRELQEGSPTLSEATRQALEHWASPNEISIDLRPDGQIPSPLECPPVAEVEGSTVRFTDRFPAHHRINPISPFAERWLAKQADYLLFVDCWERANATLSSALPGWRLPDELAADWSARWTEDLFRFNLPVHPTIPPERVATAVADVQALLDAVQFATDNVLRPTALRFWAYTLPDDPRYPSIPTVEFVRRHLPELDPRPWTEDVAADQSRFGQFDQEQFFERASFLLATPSEDDLTWLRHLAYRADPMHRIWEEGLPWERVAGELRWAVPLLSSLLRVECDPRIADDSTPFAVLQTAVGNWCLRNANVGLSQTASNHSRSLPEGTGGEDNPRPYRPNPPPTGANPYLTLRHILHELFWQAGCARQGQDVRDHINPITQLWEGAEARARSCSAGWGIPFVYFHPILTEAKETMRELAQVASGDRSVQFSLMDPRYALLEERLKELSLSVPAAATSAPAGTPEPNGRTTDVADPETLDDVPSDPDLNEGELTQREETILREMYASGVFGSSKRLTQAKIVAKCQKNVNTETWKPTFSKLKRLGYLDSESGPAGGMWLTPKGKSHAATLL